MRMSSTAAARGGTGDDSRLAAEELALVAVVTDAGAAAGGGSGAANADTCVSVRPDSATAASVRPASANVTLDSEDRKLENAAMQAAPKAGPLSSKNDRRGKSSTGSFSSVASAAVGAPEPI